MLLRLVDRAGVFDLGGVSPAEAVSAALPRWPIEIVEVALDALAKRGIIEVGDDSIVLPNFLIAQEAAQSDAQRSRDSRERRRAIKRHGVADCSPDEHMVTFRDHVPRAVTASHTVPLLPSLTTPRQPTPTNADPPVVGSAMAETAPEPDAPDAPHPDLARPTPEPSPPIVHVAELIVEQALVEIQARQIQVRARHTGSARERVAACTVTCRTPEATANLDRELRDRGVNGVIDVLEWAWERIAVSDWSGKRREEERKRIVFAFGGAATYWGGLVAERADELARAERAAARASPVAPEPEPQVEEWSHEFTANLEKQMAALRRPAP